MASEQAQRNAPCAFSTRKPLPPPHLGSPVTLLLGTILVSKFFSYKPKPIKSNNQKGKRYC